MNIKIKKVLMLILLVITYFSCSRKLPDMANEAQKGYFLLDEFLSRHPEETNKFDSFVNTVKNEPILIQKELQQNVVNISVIYPGSEKSDYWHRSVKSFAKRMDFLGIRYNIDEYFTRPGSIDQKKQEEQLKEALNSNPDYLVFTLDINRHKEILERIITIGHPKIILQNITTPLKEWEGNQPFLYVGFSHKLGTLRVLAPEYLKITDGLGTYAMLYFSKGFVSEQRGDSFINFMNNNSNLELKTAYYTDGQYQKAKDATFQILNDYPDINFIYACSTNIALGAIDAIKESKHKHKVIVNGWGGGSAELDLISKGELDFTVMRINDDNGIAMAEAIKLDLEGRSELVPTVFSGDFELVNQSTSQEDIEKLKERAFRYSGIDK